MDNNIAVSHNKGFYEKYIKRPQDFILSLIALIVLSPVLLVTAFLVRIKLGSPIIFKQPRPGLDGKIFNMYKFRTMTDERDSEEIYYQMKNGSQNSEKFSGVPVWMNFQSCTAS